MKTIFLVALISTITGCSTFGSNIKESKSVETKGTEKVDATFQQDRKVEAPQPSNVSLSATGNSQINFTPVKEIPVKKDVTITGKLLKSSEIMDQSMNEIFEQHSGVFYVLLGIGVLMLVLALKWFESSKTGKVVFALGDRISSLQTKLMQTDRSDPRHSIYSEMMDDLREEKEKLILKRR